MQTVRMSEKDKSVRANESMRDGDEEDDLQKIKAGCHPVIFFYSSTRI